MVPGAGLEPARPYRARDFKSLASTNSATRADKLEARICSYITIHHRFNHLPCGSILNDIPVLPIINNWPMRDNYGNTF